MSACPSGAYSGERSEGTETLLIRLFGVPDRAMMASFSGDLEAAK